MPPEIAGDRNRFVSAAGKPEAEPVDASMAPLIHRFPSAAGTEDNVMRTDGSSQNQRMDMKHLFLLLVLMAHAINGMSTGGAVQPVYIGAAQNTMEIKNKAPRGLNPTHIPASADKALQIKGMSHHMEMKKAAVTDINLCNVRIGLNFNEDIERFGIYKLCIFDSNHYYGFSVWEDCLEDNKYWDVQVPVGTYDIFVGLQAITVAGNRQDILIAHEGVEITEELNEDFYQSEADKQVVFDKYLPDGKKVVLPKCTWNGSGYDWDYSDATATYLCFEQIFQHDRVGDLMNVIQNANNDMIDENSIWINEMSDAFTYFESGAVCNIDGDTLFAMACMITGDGDTVYRNDPTKFVEKKKDVFSHSSSWYNQPEEMYIDEFLIEGWYKDKSAGGCFGFTGDREKVKIYVCADADLSKPHAEIAVRECSEEYLEFWSEYDCQAALTYAPAARYNGKDWEYVIKESSPFGPPTNYHEDILLIMGNGYHTYMYPGHPEYSYLSKNESILFGNSCPICYTYIKDSILDITPDYTGFIYGQSLNMSYIGRLGETRDADSMVTKMQLKLDEESIFSGSTSDFYGFYEGWFDDHEPGEVAISIVNENVLVDGLPGKNVTEILYDERKTEIYVPSVSMLMFKNKDGEITDRFANAEDGVLMLSAGSFKWQGEGGSYENNWFICDRPEIKVELTPAGIDSWTELPVEENPDLFMMPNFGHFFKGSLADTEALGEGWYDLRITLEEGGNRQIQTISPAFKIYDGPSVGVEKTHADKLGVSAIGNNILAPSGSVIYDARGIVTDGRNLATGLYLVNTPGGCVKIVVR